MHVSTVAKHVCATFFFMGVFFMGFGCVPALPENANLDAPPPRSILFEQGGEAVFREDGVEDAAWLEVNRTDEPGRIGGYLSRDDTDRDALIILLHGASTLVPDGEVGAAREFHEEFAPFFRDAGFSTWSLAVRECGTAYGQGDLADLLSAINWLESSGKAVLGVQRIYLIGYSTGGTLAVLANQHRTLTAMISLAGLTRSNQLEEGWALYDLLANLFPNNVGLCQLGSTLAHYGPPGSPAWDALNSVDRLDQFKSPMLFVHGTADQIFSLDNTLTLQGEYERRLAEGQTLAPLEFAVLEGVDHFALRRNPEIIQLMIDYLLRFEPEASQ